MRAAIAEGALPLGKHATIVEFFRAHPELTTVLLRLGGIRLSRALVPQIVESTFPASIPDRDSDAAVAYLYGKDPKVLAVVEVQLAIDKEKPARWLSYHVAGVSTLQEPARIAVILSAAKDPTVRAIRLARKEWAPSLRSG
jgi:hypothetical protein